MTPQEILNALAEMEPWHHNVELAPGIWSNPRMGNHPTARWNLIEPYIPRDLTGKSVLDLGCSSGFFASMFKLRGADRVVAVDIVDSAISEARLLNTIRQTSVEIVQADIYDFLIENRESFDYVIFLGIFYHLRSPLFALDRLVQITRERLYFQTWVRNEGHALQSVRRMLFAAYELGVLTKRGQPRQAVTQAWQHLTHPLVLPDNLNVAESYLMSHPDFPKLSFIQKCANNDATNWWVGDTATIQAILTSTGFSSVQRISDDTFICDNVLQHPADLRQYQNDLLAPA